MSVSWTRSDIERTQKEIENLQRQIADENKKESSNTERILRVKGSISSSTTTSESSLRSKYSEIERYEKDIYSSQKKRADLSKKVSEKTGQLYKLEQKLFSEQQNEQKKFRDDLERKSKDEQRKFQDELKKLKNDETQRQNSFLQQVRINQANEELEETYAEKSYDVFISHASEDKDDFVRPLAEKLTEAGFSVWYDEFQLKIGDKLRRSIDRGLANSRFGIVVFSPDFFQKNWTQYELDGLVQKEMTGKKAILPLWHKVSKDEVMKYSPSLADTIALNTAMYTIEELVEKLSEVLK